MVVLLLLVLDNSLDQCKMASTVLETDSLGQPSSCALNSFCLVNIWFRSVVVSTHLGAQNKPHTQVHFAAQPGKGPVFTYRYLRHVRSY